MFKLNTEKYNKIIMESKKQGSIYNYYTDDSRHENKNKCVDFTPPFISYVPTGINEKNITLENDLKGINRINSHCANEKYIPSDQDLAATPLYNLNECSKEFKIIKNGYIN